MLYQEKMQANEEPNEQLLSCFVYRNTRPYFVNHWHTYFEIYYVIQNISVITVNGKARICRSGDMVFIPPMASHAVSYANDELSENMILQFDMNFLEQSCTEFVQIKSINPGKKLQQDMAYNVDPESRMGRICTELQKLCEEHPEGCVFKPFEKDRESLKIAEYWNVKSLVFSLLSSLMREEVITCSQQEKECLDLSEISKLEPVLKRMSDHVEEKLSMETAAQIAGMSYYNFCRNFKQMMGMSFVEYQNKLRVRRAEELLHQTDKNITEIADIVNFGTLSYFNRIFKKYNGKSPSDYRKNALLQKRIII